MDDDNERDELDRVEELCLYVLETDPRRPEPMPVFVVTGRLTHEYGLPMAVGEARRALDRLVSAGRVARGRYRDRYCIPWSLRLPGK